MYQLFLYPFLFLFYLFYLCFLCSFFFLSFLCLFCFVFVPVLFEVLKSPQTCLEVWVTFINPITDESLHHGLHHFWLIQTLQPSHSLVFLTQFFSLYYFAQSIQDNLMQFLLGLTLNYMDSFCSIDQYFFPTVHHKKFAKFVDAFVSLFIRFTFFIIRIEPANSIARVLLSQKSFKPNQNISNIFVLMGNLKKH